MSAPHDQSGTELVDDFGCHPDSAPPTIAGEMFVGLFIGLALVVPIWLALAAIVRWMS